MDKYPFTPENLLLFMLLGSLFGMLGQGARVIVGVKKSYTPDASGAETPWEIKRLVYSLIIALVVGAVAGTLAVIAELKPGDNGVEEFEFGKETIWIWIGAGYAGTDFIEGLFKK